jgi:hypothetical protein
MLPGHPQQTTLFVETAEDVGFGIGPAWKVRDGWKSKALSLGKYLTEADAASFAIGVVLNDFPAILLRTCQRRAEIVTKSRTALSALQSSYSWALRTITVARRDVKRVGEEGGTAALTWLSSSTSSNGGKIASTAAQRAAKQPPKAMRSASLSYVKQAVRERWKPATRLNKHIKDARKSVASRYLQLKSGHAITGAHLMRIGKVEDARCWWCSGSRQTVAHLLIQCRRWLREREIMVRKLRAKGITISETPDRRDLKILFEDNAIVDMLEFVEKTDVGKRPGADIKKVDSWDIE